MARKGGKKKKNYGGQRTRVELAIGAFLLDESAKARKAEEKRRAAALRKGQVYRQPGQDTPVDGNKPKQDTKKEDAEWIRKNYGVQMPFRIVKRNRRGRKEGSNQTMTEMNEEGDENGCAMEIPDKTGNGSKKGKEVKREIKKEVKEEEEEEDGYGMEIPAQTESRHAQMADRRVKEEEGDVSTMNAVDEDREVAATEKEEEEEEEQLSILDFPNDILLKIYPDLDLASRRALRVNERLAGIEMLVKYRQEFLLVQIEDNTVSLTSEDAELSIPVDEVEKEFKLLGTNTHFTTIVYKSNGCMDRRTVTALRFLKADTVDVTDPNLDDSSLQCLLENRKIVSIDGSAVTANGILWMYEKMRDRELNLDEVFFFSDSVEQRWDFMNKLGLLDRETLVFSTTNPNLTVRHDEDYAAVREGSLIIGVNGISRESKKGEIQIEIQKKNKH